MIFICASSYRNATKYAESNKIERGAWKYVYGTEILRGAAQGEILFLNCWNKHACARELYNIAMTRHLKTTFEV